MTMWVGYPTIQKVHLQLDSGLLIRSTKYCILLCNVLSRVQDIVKSYSMAKPEIVKLGPLWLENGCFREQFPSGISRV